MTHLTSSIPLASPDETLELGGFLGSRAKPNDLVLLTGDLGAGKTQLTKGIAGGLGSPDTVTSPTFNILIAHTDGRIPLYHLDLYRLDQAADLEDIDFYGTAESGGLTVVEWGDRFDEVAEIADLTIALEITGDTARTAHLTALSDRGDELIMRIGALYRIWGGR